MAAIGHTEINPHTDYPPQNHPVGRAFSWERGRVLQSLQIVAIRRGAGEVQWLREQHAVTANTVFIIKPSEWHRYRPSPESGWVEDWFELRGILAEHWLAQGLLPGRFLSLENSGRFFERFDRLHALAQTRAYVPEGMMESEACALVAEIAHSRGETGRSLADKHDRELVARARKLLTNGTAVAAVADQLGVSYLSLYRSFRRCSGLSPKQFSENSRLAQAEAYLVNEGLSIKEIAAALGYHTASHFSIAFKRRYGVAPANWRTQLGSRKE